MQNFCKETLSVPFKVEKTDVQVVCYAHLSWLDQNMIIENSRAKMRGNSNVSAKTLSSRCLQPAPKLEKSSVKREHLMFLLGQLRMRRLDCVDELEEVVGSKIAPFRSTLTKTKYFSNFLKVIILEGAKTNAFWSVSQSVYLNSRFRYAPFYFSN